MSTDPNVWFDHFQVVSREPEMTLEPLPVDTHQNMSPTFQLAAQQFKTWSPLEIKSFNASLIPDSS